MGRCGQSQERAWGGDTLCLSLCPPSLPAAAGRGVQVRFLLAERFRKTYPELAAHFGSVEGIEVRFIDFGEVAGGVMHAKYMVVDGAQAFLGSPNFDFRAMDQIQELGAHLVDRSIAEGLSRIFEMDWALAGGAKPRASVIDLPGDVADGDEVDDEWLIRQARVASHGAT